MLKQLSLLIVFTFNAMVAFASNQYVTIGTNIFGFAFEDTTLTTNMQARIIDDWKIMTAPWTNLTMSIDNITTNIVKGSIKFDYIGLSPNFESADVNYDYYKTVDLAGSQKILISKKLTDRYKIAFSFADSHVAEISKIPELLFLLQPDVLVSMPSNQMSNIFYYHGVPIENYALGANDIKRELLSYEHYTPSVLFYAEMPKDFLEHPEDALWAFIPIRDTYSTWNRKSISFATAIYIDGRWRIRPLPMF